MSCQTPETGGRYSKSYAMTVFILAIIIISVIVYFYRASLNAEQGIDSNEFEPLCVTKRSTFVGYESDYHDEKTFFSLDYRVKGSFYRARDAFDSINVGSPIYFEKEPSNLYDEYAVKVISKRGKHIGYIERCESESIFKNLDYIRGAEIYKLVEGEATPYIWVRIYFCFEDKLPAKLYDEDIRENEIDCAVNRIKRYNPLIIIAERYKKGRPQDALRLYLDIANSCDEIYPKHECLKIFRRLKMYDDELSLIDNIIEELSDDLTKVESQEIYMYECAISKYENRKKYVEKLLATKRRKEKDALERKRNPSKRGRKPKSTE